MGVFYRFFSGPTQRNRARLMVTLGCRIARAIAVVRRFFSRRELWRILVVKPDAVGDFILATPFLRELRRSFPKTHITLVVHPRVLSLAENCPHVNRILAFDPSVPRAASTEYRQLRALGFALTKCSRFGVDLAVLARSGDDYYDGYQLMLGCAPSRIAGFTSILSRIDGLHWKSLVPTHAMILPATVPSHEVTRNLNLLKAIGGTVGSEQLELWLTADDKMKTNGWLHRVTVDKHVPKIALGIGAADEARRWPAERFAELCKFLIEEYDAQLILIGAGAEDAADAATIVRLTESSHVLNAVDAFSLRETAALLENGQLFVGNDSGPMHLAAAVGIPVVEISALPEDEDPNSNYSPVRFGPWQVRSRIVRPTTRSGHSVPAQSADVLCINEVTTSAVYSAVKELLDENIASTARKRVVAARS
jgi:heptosyltransferase-2